MNTRECRSLADALDAKLTVPRLAVNGSKVWIARRRRGSKDDPVLGLWDLEDDEGELEDPWSDLEEAGRVESLLSFLWMGLGPTSSWASIKLLRLPGKRAYAAWSAEDEGTRVIARFERLGPQVTAAFLSDLMKRNGAAYDVGLFGGLPSHITNDQPRLLSRQAVRIALGNWMRTEGRRDPSHWTSLRDNLISESEQPDHLAERNRILDNYFAASYCERPLTTRRTRRA